MRPFEVSTSARIGFLVLLAAGLLLTLGRGPANLEGATALHLQAAVDHEGAPEQAPRVKRSTDRALRDRGLAIARYTDAGANVALFVPLGVLLALGWPPPRWRLVAVLSGVSATIELLQATIVTSRSGQISDWVANSVGAALGIVIAGLIAAVVHRRRHGPGIRRGAL